MEKTTVYLTNELQQRLKQTARATGRSEATLIREALAEYLVNQPRTTPRSLGSIELDLPDGVNSSNVKSWIRERWAQDIVSHNKRQAKESRR